MKKNVCRSPVILESSWWHCQRRTKNQKRPAADSFMQRLKLRSKSLVCLEKMWGQSWAPSWKPHGMWPTSKDKLSLLAQANTLELVIQKVKWHEGINEVVLHWGQCLRWKDSRNWESSRIWIQKLLEIKSLLIKIVQ